MIAAKASTRAALLGLVLLVGCGPPTHPWRYGSLCGKANGFAADDIDICEPDPGPMQGEWMGHLMQEGYTSPATSMGILPKECPGPPAGYHMKQLPSGELVYRLDDDPSKVKP